MSQITIKVGILFAFMAVGFILKKTKVLDDKASKNISALVFNFLMPCMITEAIVKYFDRSMLGENFIMPLVCVVSLFILFFVGTFISRGITRNEHSQGTYTFAIMFPNFSFMAYPIIQSIYGKESIIPHTFYIIPMYIIVNSLGPLIINKVRGQKLRFSHIVNGVNISTILGFVIVYNNIKLPDYANDFLSMSSSSVVPISMILIGIVLANGKFMNVLLNYRLYMITAMRLFIVPLALFFVLYLIGLRGMLLYVPTMVTAMPVAVNGVVLSESSGGDTMTMAELVFMSTLISLFTIPIISTLIARF